MSVAKQVLVECQQTAVEQQRRFEQRTETQRLLNEAIIAVSTLATHLKEIDDPTQFHGANRALRELWAME